MARTTTTKTNCLNYLEIVSYNMHGFNQGYTAVQDLITSINPDVFLLQEHWLTPFNLSFLIRIFLVISRMVAVLCRNVWKVVCYVVGLSAV